MRVGIEVAELQQLGKRLYVVAAFFDQRVHVCPLRVLCGQFFDRGIGVLFGKGKLKGGGCAHRTNGCGWVVDLYMF